MMPVKFWPSPSFRQAFQPARDVRRHPVGLSPVAVGQAGARRYGAKIRIRPKHF